LLHAEAFEPEVVSGYYLIFVRFIQFQLHPWFEQRTAAIAKKFYQFLAELCRGTMSFKAEDALSDLHIMRCSYNKDADFCSNALDWVARSIHLNMRENFEATKNTNMAVRT
jgi:hypothetical protein